IRCSSPQMPWAQVGQVVFHHVHPTPRTYRGNSEIELRFFALTLPGLGPLLRDELAGQLGSDAVGDVENDGRSEVVPYSAGPVEPVETSLSEDVFVELGTADPSAPLRRLVGQLWSAERYDAALPTSAPRLGRLGPRPGFRVVARVRSERGFL